MYCTKCGAPGYEDDAFCASCGAALRGPADGSPPPAAAGRPAYTPAREPPPSYPRPTEVADYQDLPDVAPHAPFGTRVGGYIIDSIINFFATTFVSVGLRAALLPRHYTQADLNRVEGILVFTLIPASFAYKWLMDSYGGTLGKRIVGLWVVDDLTMRPPGIGPGFVRTIVSIGSGLVIGLGYLWAAWDREGKTWHDHAAHTMVVRRRDAP